ncbi:MAG: alpha-amylase, partial [Prevotella sp.]|nr:alpha-amylase [Prevotella sp.]
MRKISTLIFTLAMPLMMLAQGWPANYGGVMLQGFFWDSFVDTQWTNLEKESDEISEYFDLVWVPQSGNCNTSYNVMGYAPVYWWDQNCTFGTEAQLRSMINSYKQKGVGVIADVVINHRGSVGVNGSWVDFPAETYNGVTYQMGLADICKNDDGGNTAKNYPVTGANDTGEDWGGMRDLDHTSKNVQDNV